MPKWQNDWNTDNTKLLARLKYDRSTYMHAMLDDQKILTVHRGAFTIAMINYHRAKSIYVKFRISSKSLE